MDRNAVADLLLRTAQARMDSNLSREHNILLRDLYYALREGVDEMRELRGLPEPTKQQIDAVAFEMSTRYTSESREETAARFLRAALNVKPRAVDEPATVEPVAIDGTGWAEAAFEPFPVPQEFKDAVRLTMADWDRQHPISDIKPPTCIYGNAECPIC